MSRVPKPAVTMFVTITIILTVIGTIYVRNNFLLTPQPDNIAIARQYLETKGYQIINYEGNAPSYVMTEENIVKLPYMMEWSVQEADPLQYFGKTVDIEKFVVTGHSLDNWQSASKVDPVQSEGKARVSVLVVEGRAVGGISFPYTDTNLYGWCWSIDGRTLEEIDTTYENYPEWHDRWVARFNN